MMAAADQPPVTLRLVTVTPYARSMGLRRGDLLVGLRGKAVTGDTRSTLSLMKAAQQSPIRLTFRRANEQWDVICLPRQLGRWSAGPHQAPVMPIRPDQGLRNWDVMTHADGLYDVQPQGPRLLAVVVPLYLLQMRLWGPLAIWAGVLALGVGLGLVWAVCLQALMSLYFWRAAPVLVRADRVAHGFRLWRVFACSSERDAHDRMRQIAPDLRFMHQPAAFPAKEPAG